MSTPEEQATRPTGAQLARMVSAFYAIPGNEVGGSLHIVLDDQNLEDSNVRFCIEGAHERGDLAGELLGWLLLGASRSQRARAAAGAP